jgi:hypothetical protein
MISGETLSNEKNDVAYSIPIKPEVLKEILKYAYIPNSPTRAKHFGIEFSRCYLVIGDGGKLIRTIPDLYPDMPWTVKEFLEKYPNPLTAEQWLEKYKNAKKQ